MAHTVLSKYMYNNRDLDLYGFAFLISLPSMLSGHSPWILGGGVSLRPLEALHLFLLSTLEYHLSGNHCAWLEVCWLTKAIVSGS